MLQFRHTRRTLTGGLYFGPPGWSPTTWETLAPGSPDGSDAASVPENSGDNWGAMLNGAGPPISMLRETRPSPSSGRTDTPDTAAPAANRIPPPASVPELLDILQAAGIDKTSAWIPSLPSQLAAVGIHPIRIIIANFLPLQPESALPQALTAIAPDDLLLGLHTVRHCVAHKTTAIVMDRHNRPLIKRWRQATRKSTIRLVRLLNVHPQGDPTILLRSLFGARLPVGAPPPSVGALMLDPVACWALGRFLRSGTPCHYRPVQVFAFGTTPRLLLAPRGQTVAALLDQCGLPYAGQQCICNGMLSGRQIDPAAERIADDTEMLSLRPIPVAEEPFPCIECGWCLDHCPTALNPAKLYHLALAQRAPNDVREAQFCIDCGLCSYVCPTRLPLTQRIVDLRTVFRQRTAGATALERL